MTKTIPFFSGRFAALSNFSSTGRSLILFFADTENKGITRRVCVPRKSVKVVDRGRFIVYHLPYWFIKDKGLDSITATGQLKWSFVG